MNTAPRFRLGQLVGLPRICLRQRHGGKPRPPTTGFQGPEGHGEKIWVWAHRRSEQVIYTFRAQLDNHQDLKQLPYNGKKTKPAKLRKDYWSPMATIEFAHGQGSVGRTVFHKLRELKHLHEVQWDEDVRYKSEKEYTKLDKKKVQDEIEKGNYGFRPLRSVKQRGWALNAQKKNAIADIAVVLSGAGRGNKVAVTETEAGNKELVPVTVNWANDQDREFAAEWSGNVTHGLFEEPSYVSGLAPAQAPAIPKTTTPEEATPEEAKTQPQPNMQ